MGGKTHVKIGQIAVGCDEDEFIIIGLGSCIALFIWAPEKHIGGLAHILLDRPRHNPPDNPAKYATTAVEALARKVCDELSDNTPSLIAKMVGGSVMLPHIEHPTLLNIGLRTAETVRGQLQSLMINLIAEDIGGNEGRSIVVYAGSGRIHVRSRSGEKWL